MLRICAIVASFGGASRSTSVYESSPREWFSMSAMLMCCAARRGQDLRDHVRHVRVRDREAMRARALQHGLGEVHRARHVAVLEELAHVVRDHHGAVLLGLDRGCPEVRQGRSLSDGRAMRAVGKSVT